MSGRLIRQTLSVRGVVQGVGFRPFVYRLAHEYGLTGWVLNHSGGVEIEVEGPAAPLAAFVHDLEEKTPPLARIEGIEVADAPPVGYTTFEIRHSITEEGRYQLISPDIATCPDCLRELLDPADRRHRYPFTNCTNCGPRFTIIADIPYDRPLTTMRDFAMCPQCQAEYDDPLDRRFHAQPNACSVCGPHVWLVSSDAIARATLPHSQTAIPLKLEPETDDAVAHAARLLRAGAILAIKGLGGFHLACDATDEATVRTLRERKGRPAKPLAVMMATLEEIKQHCWVSEEEEWLLTSSQCPIVLLPWKPESNVSRLVAPRGNYLGVMLPYTPLHHVLLRDVGRPLVMTSMENLETLEHFETTIELYKRLFRIQPEIIAYDLHPEYLSTKYAKSQISNLKSQIAVQHHHAHIASCLADNGWTLDDGPVIGVAWDGTGYGSDGRLWGGEFLVADYRGFRRAAHLEYLPMPGGEAAIRNPYRLAIGYLYALTGRLPSLRPPPPPPNFGGEEELRIIQQQVDKGINCPQTSAGGRLFDAVSALLGVREHITYEAQAAVELEMAAQIPNPNQELSVWCGGRWRRDDDPAASSL